MENFQVGDHVEVVDAEGEHLPRRALGGVKDGEDFPVVWVCREDEWVAASREGRQPEGVPWPAEDVSTSAGSRTVA